MASQRTSEAWRYVTAPAYAVGVLFVVMPLVDTFAQVWPPAPGNPSWRYGTVGIGANYLISMLFGMLLLAAVASLQSHRRTLLLLVWLDVVAAVVALGATVSFILDALQVRAGVPRDNATALRMFDIGAEKAVFKYLATEVVLLWLAFASWRAARTVPRAAADEAPKLVSQRSAKS